MRDLLIKDITRLLDSADERLLRVICRMLQ